jgi:putative Mg2+ transporter-C (MgtC) family protein
MATTLEWHDIALRLALTVVAGSLLGLNRAERDKPAGMRTTLLVCLAAAVAMIQANLLLATTGKGPEAFATIDVLRLPLGVLTGMGFIGAGVIIRKGELIQGVTTAATLWLATVVGLCLGGGQLGVGLAAVGLGLFALTALAWVERRLPRDRQGTLLVSVGEDGPSDDAVRAELTSAGYQLVGWWETVDARSRERRRTLRCEVRWRGHLSEAESPPFLGRLAKRPGVRALRWRA